MSKRRYGTRVPDIKSRNWRCRNVKWVKLKYCFPRCANLMTIGWSNLAKRAEQLGMRGRGSEPGFQLACEFSASETASYHCLDGRANRLYKPSNHANQNLN